MCTFKHTRKKNCLRREANLDRWIRRRTFSLCTSRPRLALSFIMYVNYLVMEMCNTLKINLNRKWMATFKKEEKMLQV